MILSGVCWLMGGVTSYMYQIVLDFVVLDGAGGAGRCLIEVRRGEVQSGAGC